MSNDQQLLVARLREAGAHEIQGRYQLGASFGRGRGVVLPAPPQYLLKLVQAGVAAGARRITIEGSRYGTTFMHDGAVPSGEALADLLLGRPLPSVTRQDRSLRALADGLDACLDSGATVEVNVRREDSVVHAELSQGGCVVDPTRAGRLSAHWDLRVIVKDMKIPFGDDVRLVRERCRYAPSAMMVDERPLNIARFGGPPLGFTDMLLGRATTCLLPPPFMVGCYPRGRHVVDIRWLLVSPDACGIALPQPADACLTYERAWDEQTWPRVDDPGITRSDADRNRHRRSFIIPDGEDQRRIGVYQGIFAMRARDDAPSRMVLVMDGVNVEDGPFEGVPGVDVVLAVDDLTSDESRLCLLDDAAHAAIVDEVRNRAGLLERVLGYEFEGADRSTRVAHAISGRAGARVLRW